MQPTPIFLPGEFHGPRSLPGYSHGLTESDTTERQALSLSFRKERSPSDIEGRPQTHGKPQLESAVEVCLAEHYPQSSIEESTGKSRENQERGELLRSS